VEIDITWEGWAKGLGLLGRRGEVGSNVVPCVFTPVMYVQYTAFPPGERGSVTLHLPGDRSVVFYPRDYEDIRITELPEPDPWSLSDWNGQLQESVFDLQKRLSALENPRTGRRK